MTRQRYGLVAEIGGTTARFALADLHASKPTLVLTKLMTCAEFPSIEAAIESYLAWARTPLPDTAVLAVAGPVTDGVARLTNHEWMISEAALEARGCSAVKLVNDYAALGLGAIDLEPSKLRVLGPHLTGRRLAPVIVMGAGTGFGAAVVSNLEDRSNVIVTEAGHSGFSPTDEIEFEIAKIVQARYGRASVERLLSGSGLMEIYGALTQIRGAPVRAPSPEVITRLAVSEDDDLCIETVERFCLIYGAVAGDLALASGARRGVFLGGAIAPEILRFLTAGGFRDRFEAKGRLSGYVKQIPTHVILADNAALLGAAKQLRRMQPLYLVG